MRKLITLIALAAALVVAAPASAADGTPQQLSALLANDMTQPHEFVPHGVPPSYDWQLKPKISPPPPTTFRATTAWMQWYRCAQAGLDDNDVLEIQRSQTWILDSLYRWRLSQAPTIPFSGAAYAEDFHSPQIPLNIVANSATQGWLKTRMSNEGYNAHVYPRQRGGYLADSDRAVVVIVQAKLWAYSPGTQCTVFGAGIDFWSTSGSSVVSGGSLGRLKHVDTSTRAFTATSGDRGAVLANPPPVSIPEAELR